MQLGQGRERAREHLKENPAVAEELKEKILAACGQGAPPSVAAAEEGEGTGDRD